MTLQTSTGIVVSRRNTTDVPLGAGATFLGQSEKIDQFVEVSLSTAGGPNNADAEFYFEFSPDDIHWDVSVLVGGAAIISPNDCPPQRLAIILPYFRVRYVNGAVPQTDFRLTTVYHRTTAARLTRYLNQEVFDNEGVENTSAVIRYFDGTSYAPISNTNRLPVEGARPATAVTSTVASSASNVTLLSANSSRRGGTIYNESTADLYIKLGVTASLTDFTVRMIPGSYYETPYNYTGRIDGIWVSANGNARITELV